MRRGPRDFETTRWSVVLDVANADPQAARRALATICEAYWYPIYAYIRRQGQGPDDAQDVAQSFFAMLIEREDLAKIEVSRGRFRSFLLAAAKNFLLNDVVHRSAKKRGAGQPTLSLEFDDAEQRYRHEPCDPDTPEQLFDRQWALLLIGRSLDDLRREWQAAGKTAEFDLLKECLMGEPPDGGYEALAAKLDSNPNATRVAVHRLRRRFRQRLREAIADTVASETEVDAEIHYLLKAVSRGL